MRYDDEDRGWRWIVNIGIVLLFALVAAGGFWFFTDEDSETKQIDLISAAATNPAPIGTDAPPTTTTPQSTVASSADAPTTSTTSEAEVAQAGPTLPGGGTSTAPTSSTSDPPSPSSTTGGTTATTDLGYPTNPDGTPLPIIAVFDTDTITITGQVPSEAARERLIALAIANSKTPAEVIDNMVVNERVPLTVGVRVLELNSVRFPEGNARIEPAHALELDRVVAIMNALPNITVLVVGHADPRGDEATNFAISDERARAVVNYLRFLGISPTRLSSRAAGESDLLTLDDDNAALALNRRTEFIFYGLLIP